MLARDSQQRAQALELDSFIVEAPAGAGKTELLTQRYLRLLATVEEPEEILAITFTNKAAAEMRGRILWSLQQAADGICPEAAHKQVTHALACQALAHGAARDWQLLAQPGRMRLLTIDALCAQLARQMPLLSRFGSQPKAAEEAQLHYQEAARRTLALLDDEPHGEVVAQVLAHFGNNSQYLRELLVAMLARREQWLPQCLQALQHAHELPAQFAQAVAALQAAALQAAHGVLDDARQRTLMPLLRFAAANLESDAHALKLLQDWTQPLPPTADALPQWLALLSLLLTNEDSLRKTVDKRAGFPANGAEAKAMKQDMLAFLQTLSDADAEVLARLRALPMLDDPARHAALVLAISQLLVLASAQLWLVFHAAGEVDFSEIAHKAMVALGDVSAPSELALRLDYRIQHLLVDEFQDTSPLQVALLERLTAGWQAGDGRTLFVVGDPMQSIYRFRQAEVGLFLRVAAHGIGEVRLTPLHLYRNNRSCPEVVAWFNQSFAGIFPAADAPASGAIRYRPAISARHELSADGALNGVFVHAVAVAADTGTSALHQREAQCILELIESERARFPERRIAVLVRARSHLAALVAEIRRSRPQLHFQAVEIATLAQRQVVQDLLSLTHALLHRGDRLHWLALLRAPWCGLTLHDLHVLAADDAHSTLWQLMQDDARLARMSEDGRQRLRHVRDVLAGTLAQQGRMPLARWLESCWLRLGGAACLAAVSQEVSEALSMTADVRSYLELVAKLEAGGSLDLAELERRLEKLFAAPDSHPEAERLQFMTVHKSKGLEFDSVILPGLARKAAGGDSQLLCWDALDEVGGPALAAFANERPPATGTTLQAHLRQREAARSAEEDRRVLYVAATRAIRRLHLVAALSANSKGAWQPAAGSFLALLWPLPAVQEAFALTEMMGAKLDASGNEAAKEPQDADGGQAAEGAEMVESVARVADFVPRLLRVPVAAVPALWREHEAALAQSQPVWAGTSLPAAEGLATASAAPSADVVAEVDKEADGPLHFDRLTTEVGILVHGYLELIAREGLAAWPLERLEPLSAAMEVWLQRRGFEAAAVRQGVAKATQALRLSLQSEAGQWLLGAHEAAVAEQALSSPVGPASAAAGGFQQHVVDRSFIHAGARWIIDYKTAWLGEEAPSEASLQAHAERFREQLERYAGLYAAEGRPVRLAIFYALYGRLVELTQT